MFPSPYGVSFILTKRKAEILLDLAREVFPSPYGVIFILTCLDMTLLNYLMT